MKKVINIICFIVSLIFIVTGLFISGEGITSFPDQIIGQAILGTGLIYSGSLGMLLLVYLYNIKK